MTTAPASDDVIRGRIIAAGGMDDIHDLESRTSRDRLSDRACYREGLEILANRYSVSTDVVIGAPYVAPLPYGPA